jgi:gluconolactonase
VDLLTAEGLASVGGEWRVHDAVLAPVEFRSAGPDGQPGESASHSFEIHPAAGWAGFDDSAWPVVAPSELSLRRGPGKVSFVWYRLRLEIPETIEGVPVLGRSATFEVVVDDAAEVWVDGELRRCPGQAGGSVGAGWNAPNRVVVARELAPGRQVEIAVFGMNGPVSVGPTNYVYLKRATLELGAGSFEPEALPTGCEVNVAVDRFDPAIDGLFSRNPKAFLLAEGFTFTEGPVWSTAGGGALLFSDPNENRIWKWTPAGALAVFEERSGYDGADLARYRQPGSNGLAIDAAGRLLADEHGRRRVVRYERDGSVTVVADRFAGKRLNSPNDLAVAGDGSVYFTDPFFGLPGLADDPAKELPAQGVYRARGGEVELLTDELLGPNGLAFSPDGHFLYVGNWDEARKIVRRYPVGADGRLGAGETFADLTAEPGEDAIDGVETDVLGNVYVSGPGGLWIFGADGRRLGRLRTPRHVHNLAWGEDGTVLYLAARDHLYRVPTKVRGHAPHLAPPPVRAARDPRLDVLVPAAARPELLAAGFHWLEGPAWDARRGALLFSDIPGNTVWALPPGGSPRVELARSGYSGSAPFNGREPGSNGLVFDREGRLILCQHGDRRVVRREADGSLTVLADRFEGKRLNSPNDAIVTPSGEVWFTDPPFGLPGGFADAGREIPFQGVYRIRQSGAVELLTSEVPAPNGLALSPDGRTFYVSNAQPEDAAIYAFDVRDDGSLGPRRRFFDATGRVRAGAAGSADGLETDRQGNVWFAGPGGVHVLTREGELLGSLEFARPAANLELAADGYLYVTADTAIWRVPLGGALRAEAGR